MNVASWLNCEVKVVDRIDCWLAVFAGFEAEIAVDIVSEVLRLQATVPSIADLEIPDREEPEEQADESVAVTAIKWETHCQLAGLSPLERRVIELRQGRVADKNGDYFPRPRKLVARILSEEGDDRFQSGGKPLDEPVRQLELAAIGKLRRAARLD